MVTARSVGNENNDKLTVFKLPFDDLEDNFPVSIALKHWVLYLPIKVQGWPSSLKIGLIYVFTPNVPIFC